MKTKPPSFKDLEREVRMAWHRQSKHEALHCNCKKKHSKWALFKDDIDELVILLLCLWWLVGGVVIFVWLLYVCVEGASFWLWLGGLAILSIGPHCWHGWFERIAKLKEHLVPADKEERWSWYLLGMIERTSESLLGEQSGYAKQVKRLNHLKQQILSYRSSVLSSGPDWPFLETAKRESDECLTKIDGDLNALEVYRFETCVALSVLRDVYMQSKPRYLFEQHYKLSRIAGCSAATSLLSEYEEEIVGAYSYVVRSLAEIKSVPLLDVSMDTRSPLDAP